MQDDVAAIVDGIGPRLRAIRIVNGATLEGVAQATGISLSTLSRLESGKRRPTLELLIPLARHYRVALDHLIDAPQTGDPRIHLQPVPRRRGGVIVPVSDYPGRVQVYKQVLEPCEPRLVTHDGYEWLYVLAGVLRLIVDEDESTLRPGEIAEFDTRRPHWFGPADGHTVELLHLTTPHADQPVVRVSPPT
ncbi:MAG: helix-turn-helix domain-containing protein [Nocardioidaceae bacterium]